MSDCRFLIAVVLTVSMSTACLAEGRLSAARNATRGEERSESRSSDSGTLDEARESVREDDRPLRRRRRRRGRRSPYFCHPLVAGVFWNWDFEPAAAVPPPIVDPPPRLFPEEREEPSQPPLVRPICRFPYDDGCEGYVIDSSTDWESRGVAARFRLERGFRVDDVSRWGFDFLVEHQTGLGLQTEWNRYTESLPSGRDDQLDFGDVNLVFRTIETEQLHLRLGVGLNWMHDRFGTEAGFNFTLGVDLFPRKPWIVSAELDLGSIGEASLVHGRVTAGATWDRFEIFAGYDFRAIDSASLHGPLLGVRVWF